MVSQHRVTLLVPLVHKHLTTLRHCRAPVACVRTRFDAVHTDHLPIVQIVLQNYSMHSHKISFLDKVRGSRPLFLLVRVARLLLHCLLLRHLHHLVSLARLPGQVLHYNNNWH